MFVPLKDDSMKILITKHIYEFVVALAPTGIDIYVPDNAKRMHPIKAPNVHVVPNDILNNTVQMAEYVSRHEIDMVYAQGRGDLCFYSRVQTLHGAKARFRIITTAHTGYIWECWWKSIALMILARVKGDGLIYFSNVHKCRYNWFARLIGLKTWVVRHPVELARFPTPHDFSRLSETPLHVGYVGIITPNKMQDVLVDAIKLLRDRGRNVRLTLVGDVQYEWYHQKIKDKVREYCLENLVVIKPGIPYEAVPDFMYTLDCYVCPSKIETLPLNILEAMGAGLPIVATRVGGIPDLVCVGDNGELVHVGSSVEIANAIEKILVGKSVVKYGVRSRELAVNAYSDECFAKQMMAILRSLVIS